MAFYPKRARCSFKIQRSMTTNTPALRAFSAALSLITSSCIHTAGIFSLIAWSTISSTNCGRRKMFTNGIGLQRHGLYSSVGGLILIRVLRFLFEHSQRQLADGVGNFFVASEVAQVRG